MLQAEVGASEKRRDTVFSSRHLAVIHNDIMSGFVA